MSDIGYTTFTLDAGQWMRETASLAGPSAQAIAGQLLAALQAAGIETRLTVSVPQFTPGMPGPEPADPVVLLHAFVDALRVADEALADQHMQVARGSLDATVRLAAGDTGTATARLSLHIAPQLYH